MCVCPVELGETGNRCFTAEKYRRRAVELLLGNNEAGFCLSGKLLRLLVGQLPQFSFNSMLESKFDLLGSFVSVRGRNQSDKNNFTEILTTRGELFPPLKKYLLV